MKPIITEVATAGITPSILNDETTATVFGVSGSNAYNVLNTIKEKEFFSTEEVMTLLQLSKPTVLRKFKEWQTNPYSKEGIAYEGQLGRGGFRVSKDTIEKYAESHGITLNWEKLVTNHIEKQAEESVKATGVSREKQTLHKIELDKILLEKAELEIQYLELEADDEEDPAKAKNLRKKILEAKMRVKNIEYDIKVLEFSLEKDNEK
ncbi:MAG: hypothetical protein IJV18_02645 [Acidaminococcaceae bacterium]|nr:hypothetical protein [Acidaminococcaceae bacterium]